MKKLILFAITLAMVIGTCVIVAYAQNQEQQQSNYEVKSMNNLHSETEQKSYQNAFNKALQSLSIPEGYELKDVRSGKQNQTEVWIVMPPFVKTQEDKI